MVECLESLHKLEINTMNHIIAVNLLEHKFPKFFKRVKKHTVIKRSVSLFDNVPTWDNWDLSVYGFRAKLQEEVVHERRAIESLIDEDVTLMIEGKDFFTTLLTTIIAFINGHMQ